MNENANAGHTSRSSCYRFTFLTQDAVERISGRRYLFIYLFITIYGLKDQRMNCKGVLDPI